MMIQVVQRGHPGAEDSQRAVIISEETNEWATIQNEFEYIAFDAFRLRSGRKEVEHRTFVETQEAERRAELYQSMLGEQLELLLDPMHYRSEPCNRHMIAKRELRYRRVMYYTNGLLKTQVMEQVVRSWLRDLNALQRMCLHRRYLIEKEHHIRLARSVVMWRPLLDVIREATTEYHALQQYRAEVQLQHYREVQSAARALSPSLSPEPNRPYHLSPERQDEVHGLDQRYHDRAHSSDVFTGLWGTHSSIARL
eukprot:PhM_4_TR9547/c0_g1_i2/m.34181